MEEPPPDSEHYDYLEPPRPETREDLSLLTNIIMLGFIFIIFLTVGLAGSPKASSIVVWILLAGYVVLATASSEYSRYTWMLATALVGVHIGSIASYYSNPIIYPFIIIERGAGHESVNIDIVQLVVLVELVKYIIARRNV